MTPPPDKRSTQYVIVLVYGGVFVYVPYVEYIGGKRTEIHNVDLGSMNAKALHDFVVSSVGESVVGEFDVLFFAKDGVSLKGGVQLVEDSSMVELIAAAESNPYKVSILYVVHLNTVDRSGEGASGVRKRRQKSIGKRKRRPQKKVVEKEKSKEKEKEVVDEGVNEESDEDSQGSDIGEGVCSDEEFNEIRKMRAEVRKQQKLVAELENEIERNKWRMNLDEGSTSDNSCESFDTSACDETEESDEEVAYAEPPLLEKKRSVHVIYDENTAGKDIKWVPGLIFGTKVQFKDAVREYSIASGRPLKYKVDDKQRIQVICDKGCPFRLWLTYVKEYEGWEIKTVIDDHNCIYHFTNKLVSVKYLAKLYGKRIRRNPNWKLTEMQEEFKNSLKVEVNEGKCCRVRQKALRDVEEEMKEHYEGLRRFGGEILRSNRLNTFKISTTRLNEEDPPHFQRMYVSYDGLKKAWKAGCRPILGLDGCFLKNVAGGQLLSAVGRDGNNSILPVAMAVVETESYDSWRWFLDLVVEDLELGNGYGFTIISDQQKGLDKAIGELLPHIEQRFCTRHIYANLRKKFPSQAVRSAFYKAAGSTHPEAFKTAMRELKRVSKGAAERMKEFDPKVWTKPYFSTHCKSDSTDNNMSECFNSWILKARYMPIIDMLSDIHDMLMERMHQKRDALINSDSVVVPRVKKEMDLATADSAECDPLYDGKGNFQVKRRGIGYCVSLERGTCSCRIWDLTGIPCCHAIAAIRKKRCNPYDFVAPFFTKETYLSVYSNCLDVLRGEPFWEEVEGDTILPPPSLKKLKGRPKKLRRREWWEGRVSKGKSSRLSRIGIVMHCSICREQGHNRDKCPQKPEGEEPKERKKRGRKPKVVAEGMAEKQTREEQVATGEAEMMEETIRATENDIPPTSPTTMSSPRRSKRLQNSKEDVNVKGRKASKILFMPTPGMELHHGLGGTPPASTPPIEDAGSQSQTSRMTRFLRKSTKSNKWFKVPRQKE